MSLKPNTKVSRRKIAGINYRVITTQFDEMVYLKHPIQNVQPIMDWIKLIVDDDSFDNLSIFHDRPDQYFQCLMTEKDDLVEPNKNFLIEINEML